MEKKSSLVPGSGSAARCADRRRKAVRVCAVVSAMPESTCESAHLSAVKCESVGIVRAYGVGDHGCEDWPVRIVGVELAH